MMKTSLSSPLRRNFQISPLAMSMSSALNVFGRPLAIHGTNPMTGFYRDGYCNTGPQDHGAHTVAGVATPEFLEYSAAQGNDLRSIVSPGCKWCFCVTRWLEAYKAGPNVTPPVVLESTHQKALDKVSLEQLQQFEYKEDTQRYDATETTFVKSPPRKEL